MTSDPDQTLWLAIRQALLIVLGAIETRLGMERSVTPKRKRSAQIVTLYRGEPMRTDLDIQGTCADCMRGDCEKARQGIEHT